MSGPAALRVGDHGQDDSGMRGDLRDAERPGQGALSRMIANPSPGPPCRITDLSQNRRRLARKSGSHVSAGPSNKHNEPEEANGLGQN